MVQLIASYGQIKMIHCPRCGDAVGRTVSALLNHISLKHAHEPDLRLSCTIPNDSGSQLCCKVFRSLAAYKAHLYRAHRSLLSKSRPGLTSNMDFKICCPVCLDKLDSLRSLTTHYNSHCSDGIVVKCVMKYCEAEFSVLSSYTSHMSRNHGNCTIDSVKQELMQYSQNESFSAYESNPSDDDDCYDDGHSDERDTGRDFTRNIAMMFLKLQELYSLPSSTLQMIIEDFTDAVEVSESQTVEKIKTVCENLQVDRLASVEIINVLENSLFSQAVSNLSTEWKRKKYYKENFPYIDPVGYKYRADDMKNKSFQYVPLLKTLKAMLEREDIQSQIMNPPQEVKGILINFQNGKLFNMHPVTSKNKNPIQIVLYSDEFEVVNPLGPHKKKHKILCFYYVVGNLHMQSKSRKPVMQLLALCRSEDVKEFGLQPIADLINAELLVLENEGLCIQGILDRVYGSLMYICGDNLNSHALGGFNTSFSPNVLRPCRFCLVTRDEIQDVIHADELRLRTKEGYDNNVRVVNEDPSQSTTYGIHFNSPFNSGNFHVVGGLPPDIMHDLLEGVVPYELALVLKALISKKFIQLDKINHKIATFKYGPLDKLDKPVTISVLGDTIKQNAGRTWCLLRLLPLMLCEWVPKNDPHWQWLLELKDIVEIIFAHTLAIGHVIHLQQMVQDHIHSFKILFPDARLKPKHHFLLHYPMQIMLFGPLRQCWCMRFEAKHNYFIRTLRTLNNYINPCATLATRHQYNMAYRLISDSAFLKEDMTISSTVVADLQFLSDEVRNVLECCGITDSEPLHQCHFVKIDGISYYQKMYVVVKMHEDIPVFGRIDAIFLQSMQPYFLLKMFHAEYESHKSGYLLSPENELKVLKPSALYDYYPLTAYFSENRRYVILKNFLFDVKTYAA